jgi:DNA helicase-2/ATP-dependent DNA helicase PcrA
MPGSSASGNRSGNRGRKLKTILNIDKDAAGHLRRLMEFQGFEGLTEEEIVIDLIHDAFERHFEQQREELFIPQNGHFPIETKPIATIAPAPFDDRFIQTTLEEQIAAAIRNVEEEHYDQVEDIGFDLSILGNFSPSKYQLAVYKHLLHGSGDALIEAVAGSGKTTTILHAVKIIKTMNKSWLFVAFNRSIRTEINDRLKADGFPQLAKTCHSIGFQALSKYCNQEFGKKHLKDTADDKKYRKIAIDITHIKIKPKNNLDERTTIAALYQLSNLARLTLTDPRDIEALEEMADHYNVIVTQSQNKDKLSETEAKARPKEEDRLKNAILSNIKTVIDIGIDTVKTQGVYDYTDQLYLPYVWDLQPYQSDIILVDECQDLSAAQLDLILKCRKPGGKMIFVGDSRQAVYGFAGADAASFWNIQKRTGATLLPLSICYRCPTQHVDLARPIVPQIEAAPWAKEGILETISHDDAIPMIKEQKGQCLIICRLTAPLVKMCLELIGKGIAARVRGREIGEQLITIVDAVSDLPYYTWGNFIQCLETYEQAQIAKLSKIEDNEMAIQTLSDKVAAITTCYMAFNEEQLKTLLDFKMALIALFAEEGDCVWLSTVHRAKGLEEENIYIIEPKTLPLAWPNQKAWQYEQEKNLQYVAYTRSKNALYIVDTETIKKTDEPASWVVFTSKGDN